MIYELKDVCTPLKGTQIDTTLLSDNNPFKYINGGTKESGFYIESNTPGNTVIVSEGGASCGYVNYIDTEFWCGCHCYKLVEPKINAKYLYYALKANQSRIMELRTGAAMPNIKKSTFIHFKFDLTNDEKLQNAIVSELDKIQAALDNKKKQLKKLDELIQSKFYEMFGDPVANEKGWIKEELQSLFKVTSSKRILQSEWQNSGIPFYKVADIVNLINGNEVKPSTFIKRTTYDELYNGKLVPIAGDILITSRGTLGQCYIIREEDKFYFQDGMITWISPKIKNISPIYIKGIFSNNSFLDSLLRIANCSTVAYISIKQLSQISIPLPPLPLQEAFASYVGKVEQAKAIVNQEIAHLQELLNSRMDFYFRK